MINQTLKEYVIKVILHHLEMSGEGKTAFSKGIKMNHSTMNGFLSGGCDISLNKADAILKYIEDHKNK